MKNRSEEQEDEKGGGRNGCFYFCLIWRVIFYLSIFNLTPFKRSRYIFLNFDAWEYVGCDHTWAGIVTTLLDEVEGKNKLLFSLFRAFGRVPEPSTKRKTLVFKRKAFFCISLIAIIGLVLCFVLPEGLAGNELRLILKYVIFGVPAVAVPCFSVLPVFKNMFCPLKNKFQKDMKRKDLSVQLGFMHSVKEEIKTTTNFLRFMALKEKRQIRLVLNITNLDRCTPDKIVAVLDAINILLCDRNAPFICILAADPRILVEAIQRSSNTCSNGYQYLDRIVSLPFSLPQMSDRTKSKLLKDIFRMQRDMMPATNSDKAYPKMNKDRLLTTKEMKHVKYYLKNHDVCLPGNSVQIKRDVNTVLIALTMIKMGFQLKGGNETNVKDNKEREQIVDWIVLASHWPCRLSWILQCVEDEEQQKKFLESSRRTSQDSRESPEGIQQQKISEGDPRRLLKFFGDNTSELDKIKCRIRKLLELDGDPDLFLNFLQKKKHFTVGRLSYFSDLLLNLDLSLKQHFGLQRGFHSISKKKKETHC